MITLIIVLEICRMPQLVGQNDDSIDFISRTIKQDQRLSILFCHKCPSLAFFKACFLLLLAIQVNDMSVILVQSNVYQSIHFFASFSLYDLVCICIHEFVHFVVIYKCPITPPTSHLFSLIRLPVSSFETLGAVSKMLQFHCV